MSNTITVVGNLTADPQLKYLESGDAVCNLAIASNRRTRDPDTNEWSDTLNGYFDAVIWRTPAVNVAESLSKGDRVILTGRLTRHAYEHNGETRHATEIEVDEIGPTLRFGWATPIKPNTTTTAPDA